MSNARIVLFCRQLLFSDPDVLTSPTSGCYDDESPSFRVVAKRPDLEPGEGRIRKRFCRPEVVFSDVFPCSHAVFEVRQTVVHWVAIELVAELCIVQVF